MRMKWGTISPTNIIIPATETLNPVKKDARINKYFLVLAVFTPRFEASSSPSRRALRSKQKK